MKTLLWSLILLTYCSIGYTQIITAEVIVTNVTCAGAADGAITVINPQGGSGVYEYSIDGGVTWQSSPFFNGLSAGVYMLLIRDAEDPSNVVSIGDFLILEPAPLYATFSVTPCSCGMSNGVLSIHDVNGGSPPYTYLIIDYAGNTVGTGPVTTNLPAGNYTVYITDNNGCTTIVGLISIQDTGSIITSVQTLQSHCGLDDGSAYLTITGGSEPYTISWEGYPETGQSLKNLPEGTYNVMITDQGGCQGGQSFTITQFVPSAWAISQPDNINTSACDGKIIVQVEDAYPPFTYFLNGIQVNAANDTIYNVCSGSHELSVHAAECIMDVSIEVPTGLTDGLLLNNYSLYPIPTQDKIHIELNGQPFQNGKAVIYSLQGIELSTTKLNNFKSSIDITDFKTGVYLLKLYIDNHFSVARIVKI